ncbi:MAG: BON domain-containing protein [Desulfovibrionaceae bacterium]|nr:BON domain-containing protein [Desulfovibrionaceae bacterium]
MKKLIYCSAFMAILAFSLLFIAGAYASDMDTLIESAAKQSYVFKTYLKDDDVQIQSKNGDVVLTGTVSEETSRSLARETVASLPGVKSVDNKLEVKGDLPVKFTDAWLVAKVRSTLLFHHKTHAYQTEVSAKDGIITLRGRARSAAQRDLTAEYARDVEGVKDVNNEMTVSNAAMKPDSKTMSEAMDDIKESLDDASITALAKMTLLYHRSTSVLNTTVDTKEGVVTLGGRAKTKAEKNLAAKLVGDVRGVKKVVNNMSVEDIKAI